jgi:hypothetical protein
MPLITLLNETNLKSLEYGNDQRGGVSSGQPFIVTDIPEGNDVYPVSGPDFLVRNGYLNYTVNTKDDVLRLAKWFGGGLEFKSEYWNKIQQRADALDFSNFGSITEFVKALGGNGIRGIKFTAKQNLLDLQNPKIPGIDRSYTPLSTIAQAATISSGYHLDRQGLNPFKRSWINGGDYGYYPALLELNSQDIQYGGNGRLSLLYYVKKSGLVISPSKNLPLSVTYGITNREETGTLFKYSGGPNSILSVGPTTIRIQNPLWDTSGNNNNGDAPGSDINKDNNVKIFNRIKLARQESLGTNKNTNLIKIGDFRQELTGSTYDPVSPYSNYSKFNRERGVEDGGYGTSQTYYKFINPDTGKRVLNPNLSVSSDNAELGVEGEDIIDFNFRLISNQSTKNTTIDFRAYIEDFQDSYNATWDPFKYVGRADTFYKYSGINRTFNITFVIPALSRADMIGNYQKLNALTWATMPDYRIDGVDDFGYMKGNFIRLIIGDYFKGVPAIINSLTYSPIMEMGFDINRYSAQDEIENFQNVEGTSIKRDDSKLFVGQLPKGIRAQVQMTIIHEFVPQRNKTFIGYTETDKDSKRYIINEGGRGSEGDKVRQSENKNYVANRPNIDNMEGLFQ